MLLQLQKISIDNKESPGTTLTELFKNPVINLQMVLDCLSSRKQIYSLTI